MDSCRQVCALVKEAPALACRQLDLSRLEELCTPISLQRAIEVLLQSALDAQKENADKENADKENADKEGQYQYRQ
jgi:hypothetical protein